MNRCIPYVPRKVLLRKHKSLRSHGRGIGRAGSLIGADIARAVKSSDLTERMKQQGMEPIGSTPEQFDALIRSEIEKWAKVVKVSGAKVD